MRTNSIYEAVKKATVAIVAPIPNAFPKRPFDIIGSGFCVHAEGVIVTCAHVFHAFVPDESRKRVMASQGKRVDVPNAITPHVLFYDGLEGTQLHVVPVPVSNAVTKDNFDLGLLKIARHLRFSSGYPALEIADYAEIQEMMDIATCGFPLGHFLQDQWGTVTSSFTKGMISSIIPAAGVSREHIEAFQLDLTATNGNSGGRVFSLRTGRVFGVLQGGPIHPQTGQVVAGLTRAEPIYPIFDNDLVNRLAMAVPDLHSPR